LLFRHGEQGATVDADPAGDQAEDRDRPGRYNYCLLNRYRSGADSVGLHADDEPGMRNVIGSLSLGATRTFRIRHNRTKGTRTFPVSNGTLIIMAGTMQQFWKHEVPKTTENVGERINLTFRMIGEA